MREDVAKDAAAKVGGRVVFVEVAHFGKDVELSGEVGGVVDVVKRSCENGGEARIEKERRADRLDLADVATLG